LGGWAAAKIMGAVRAAAVVSILGLAMLIAGQRRYRWLAAGAPAVEEA
jgi:hypothetical protein